MGCCSSKTTNIPLGSALTESSDQPFVRKVKSIGDSYSTVKCLGTGHFGSIYLIRDKKTGEERAAKELVKVLVNESSLPTLESELSAIKNTNHPCIAKVYEVLETSTRYYVISEYLGGGKMLDRFTEGKMSEKNIAKIMADILLALDHIHKQKLLHLNLKHSNLIYESDSKDSHLKLIDFGTTVMQKAHTFYTDSVQFMAPEFINGIANTKTDIWSAGVILYSLICGKLPFAAETNQDSVYNIVHLHPNFTSPVWSTVSPQVLTLVKKMLDKNFKNRPSADKILADPWMALYTRAGLSDEPINPLYQEDIIRMSARIQLEKAIFSFISNQVLSTKDFKQIKDLFKKLDKDGSGCLTQGELINGYDRLGLTPPPSIAEMFKKMDADGSGTVEYDEFLKNGGEFMKATMKKELEIAEKKYEKGKDAKICLGELRETIPGIQGSEWDDWLSAADSNGDGSITLDEMKKYLTEKLGI